VLAQRIDQLVVRQDDVGAEPDEQLAVREQAARLTLRELLEQRLRVDHHPVAEHAALAGVAYARRHEVGHQLLAADHQRVAGVGAATVANDDLGTLGEQVDDLALAFIAPLGADDDHDRHQSSRSDEIAVTTSPRASSASTTRWRRAPAPPGAASSTTPASSP